MLLGTALLILIGYYCVKLLLKWSNRKKNNSAIIELKKMEEELSNINPVQNLAQHSKLSRKIDAFKIKIAKEQETTSQNNKLISINKYSPYALIGLILIISYILNTYEDTCNNMKLIDPLPSKVGLISVYLISWRAIERFIQLHSN